MTKPVTKKLYEILAEYPDARLWGITRRTADCVQLCLWPKLEMTWCDGAWSCRPASGVYQQIMVFVPEDQDE